MGDDEQQRPSRVESVAIALLATLLCLANLGSGSLRDWDEATYAQVAREMHARADLTQPTLEGRPWFHKPPAVFWAIAAGYTVFGYGEFAARLPAALCGILAALLVLHLGAALGGRRVGLLAALILLSSAHWLSLAKMGMLDVPLATALVGALWAAWSARQRPPAWLISGACFGLALLIKGVAAGPVALAGLIWLLACEPGRALRSPWLWAGAALAAAIALPWHLGRYAAHGPAFVEEYLGYHVLERSARGIEGNEGGPLFYLEVLLDGFRPWVAVAALALPWCTWRAARGRDPACVLVAAWAWTVLGVGTLVGTKLEWYLIPIYPALALACSLWLLRIVPERHRRVLWAATGLVVLVVPLTSHRVLDLDFSPEIEAIAPQVRARLAPGERLWTWRIGNPAARWYTQRPVADGAPAADALRARLAAGETLWLLTRDRHRADLEASLSEARFEESARSDDRVLLRASPRRAGPRDAAGRLAPHPLEDPPWHASSR